VSPSSATEKPKNPPDAPSLAWSFCPSTQSEPFQSKTYTLPTAPDSGPSVLSAPTRIVSPSTATAIPKSSKSFRSLARRVFWNTQPDGVRW
jgi:hypothetical protein